MDLAAEIEKLLNEQYDLANKVLDEAAKNASDEAVKELKSSSPKKTGKYARGWGKTDTSGTIGGKQYTVHNKTRYRIAHLLEFGHAKVNGGRVAAIPHIAPVEQKAMKEFENEVRKGIENG